MKKIFVLLITAALLTPVYSLTLNDDFNDGVLDGWTALGGSYSIDSGGVLHQDLARSFDSTPRAVLVREENAPDNYVFQVDVGIDNVSIGNNSVGIAARVQDSSNFLGFHFFPGFPGGAFRVEKILNGIRSAPVGNTNLGFQPVAGEFYTIRLEVEGNTFTASIKNGTGDSGFEFSHTFVDSNFSGGGVGLVNLGGSAFFDNVKTENLSVTNPIPEPHTVMLVLLGFGLVFYKRRTLTATLVQ